MVLGRCLIVGHLDPWGNCMTPYGFFEFGEALFLGDLIVGALLFEVYIRALISGNSHIYYTTILTNHFPLIKMVPLIKKPPSPNPKFFEYIFKRGQYIP